MKKIVLLFTVFLIVGLYSCSRYSTATSNKWLEYELPPSRIMKNGNVFFEGKLSDGSKFSVFADKIIDDDARYYHAMLWQDFGWRLKDDKSWTAPQNARERKLGHIYINPSKQVAVYYWPDRNYSAFKAKINSYTAERTTEASQ